jgi:hypothetical protein
LESDDLFRSEVLRTLIEGNPAGFLEGFKRAVELQKNKDLGPVAKLKQDYLGKIGPNSDENDVGVNAINCISLYNTVCNRLRELADLKREGKGLSERASRNLIRAIEALCSRLEIGLEDIVGWNRAAEPWDRIKPRAKIFIVTCERPYQRIDSHQSSVKSTAFSVQDTYVYVHLHAFFAALPAKPTVQHVAVPHNLTVDQARGRLSELLAESPAAILTIGSAHGNPLSAASIRRAFDDLGKRPLPAQFVWKWPSNHLVEFLDVMADRNLPSPGIFLAPDRFLRRSCEPDGIPDAGVLVVDAREETVICCLAGHGGIGTLATASALLETSRLADALRASTSGLTGRVLQVVEVTDRETARNGRAKSKPSPGPDTESEEWLPADLFWHLKRPAWWRYALE